MLRAAVVFWGTVFTAVLGAAAAAEELSPEQARAFVAGKLFAYTCFDGTAGMGRIFADGSVIGTIRPGGRGETRFATLPPGTLRVEGNAMCAHLPTLPLSPCFRVEKIDYRSFRGSISGLSFAYCDFSQHNARAQMISRNSEPHMRASRLASRSSAPAAPQPPPAPAHAAPVAPVQAAPVAPVQAAPLVPVQASSAAPADTTPREALRPAIND